MSARKSYVADLLRLAGPTALARLGIVGMGLVDTIMVGQFTPDELPHQALGWAPTAVFLVAAIGLLQGVQVLAARAIGENNPKGAAVALRRGIVIGLIAGGVSAAVMWAAGPRIFTVFGISEELAAPAAHVMWWLALSIPLHLFYMAGTYFLEAIKKPGISTAVMWLANGVNLALNWWWVPEHGAIGSAWATVGARIFLVGALAACILLLRDRDHYGVHAFGAPGPSYGALLAVGFAAAVSQAVEAGAFSAMTVIAGRLGAEVVSAYQIMLNLLALIFMMAMGLGAASAVYVSEAIGRKSLADAARAGWTGITLNAGFMVLIGVLMLLFGQQIGRAYTADATLIAVIASLMWIGAMVLLPDGTQVVVSSALRARGDNWFPTGSHILAYACIMPVLGYWLAEHQGMGVTGLFMSIFLSSVVSAGILLMRWAVLARRPAPANVEA